jgi:hypothetical protein
MKKIVLSAALAIVSGAAFAQMTAVEDEVLSAQTGQDGISIALNVKAHIDSFEWIDTDTNGGSVRFEDIAIGGGALSAVGTGTYGGLNMNNANDVVVLAARNQYATGIRFGGPINIDVEDVAAFSAAGAGLIGSAAAGTDVAGDGAAIGAHAAQSAYTTGYVAHVPTAGTKAVVIGLPRMVMSFNVGAIRAVGTSGEAYSMGGIRVTNFDFSSTKVSIWGHK